MRRSLNVLRFLILAAILATAALAQEPSNDKKTEATEPQAPQPGPEMERMKFLLGSWEFKGNYEKTALLPQGGMETGWYKAKPGPGGFSLIADFDLDGPMGKEIGHEIFAWDPKENSYRVITFGNFPGAVMGNARWEGPNLVIRSELTMGENVLHLRAAYSNIRENSVHIEEFFQTGESPEQLLWKGDATRK
jgi:hypothetical protein